MTAGAAIGTAPPKPAIISPLVDALSAGGLSLLLLVPFLVSGRTELLLVSAGVQAWLTASVNMPHFLASYRMVYRTRESVRAHPWAAIWVPLALLLACGFAVWASRTTDLWISALLTIQNAYLAVHYTGQAWGMMAAYAFLGGTSFSGLERRLVRGGLYILLAWHVVWFFHNAYEQLGLASLYQAVTVATALALTSGLVGFGLLKARTGRFPPARTLIPWAAIFVWYAALARWGLPALFWVQMAHALQYLVFPVRVEANRTLRGEYGGPSHLAFHMTLYLVILLVASIVAAVLLPLGAMAVVTDWLGSRPGQVVGFAILAFLNIHHYFTDGVVWKLRNPAVREDLFGHVRRAEPAPAAVPAVAGVRSRRPRGAR